MGGVLHLLETSFLSNTVGLAGGGAYCLTDGLVSGGRFMGNTSEGFGGGLFVNGGVVVNGVEFLGNAAHYAGGAIDSGANGSIAPIVIANSLFARNTVVGFYGAAIAISTRSEARLLHNTIGNTTFSEKSAIAILSGPVGITNTIVANHAIGIERVNPTAVTENHNLFFDVPVWTAGGVTSGGNSFRGDPAFSLPAADDYHLGFDSLAVDRGINAGLALDFDGDARPLLYGFDIGYDEAAEAAPPAAFLPLVLRGGLFSDP
jgi:hypothetical protein